MTLQYFSFILNRTRHPIGPEEWDFWACGTFLEVGSITFKWTSGQVWDLDQLSFSLRRPKHRLLQECSRKPQLVSPCLHSNNYDTIMKWNLSREWKKELIFGWQWMWSSENNTFVEGNFVFSKNVSNQYQTKKLFLLKAKFKYIQIVICQMLKTKCLCLSSRHTSSS